MKSSLALLGFATAAVAAFSCRSPDAIADTADTPAASANVLLRTNPPVIEVPATPPGRQFLDLPALEYTFDVDARCDEDWIPESLSLSVADSRAVLGTGPLSAAEPQRIVLEVPARQLAPVAVQGFCLLEDTEPGNAGGAPREPLSPSLTTGKTVTIRALLTAQASLLCRSEEARRITHVSQPLDVRLACGRASAVAAGD